MHRPLALCLIATALLTAAVCGAHAQNAPLKKHIYRSSVPQGSDETVRLSNDAPEAVKKFYAARFTRAAFPLFREATVAPREGEMGQIGMAYGYKMMIEDALVRAPEAVEVWNFDSARYRKFYESLSEVGRTPLAPEMQVPFFYLRAEVQAERHTRAELDAVIARYEHVLHTYYRSIADASGEMKPENDRIVMTHYKKVYGDTQLSAPDSRGMDEKRRKEMQKKLKALKKEGKTSEMMELAMQLQKEMNATPTGQRVKEIQDAQMKAMMTDNWNEWIECLKELDKAGYITKIMMEGFESDTAK